MEKMEVNNNRKFWKNKRILITGHTGFKGAWLSIILKSLDSKVFGIGLKPKNQYDLFNYIKKDVYKKSYVTNLNNLTKTAKIIKKIKPEIIFHFASQSLVRESYRDPYYTFNNNFFITLNLLEILRRHYQPRVLLISTTDKVYKISNNKNTINFFNENNSLGGNDPYSASKSCVELLVESYKKSFFSNHKMNVLVARAGNVIGGGDWAKDRLIPDIFRSYKLKKILTIRNPNSTRPWQHVLDVLNGYMKFAEYGWVKKTPVDILNFGPTNYKVQSVLEVLKIVKKNIKLFKFKKENSNNFFKETQKLSLNVNKAKKILNFKPKWNSIKSIKYTVEWYQNFFSKKNPYDLCKQQIDKFCNRKNVDKKN